MTYSNDDVIAMLKKEQDGSMRALAREIGVSVAYLSDVYKKRRTPGPTILTYLGLEKTPQTPPKPRFKKVSA